MTDAWARAADKKRLAIKELEKLIPHYKYSDAKSAAMTNDKFCRLLLEKLRISKDTLFGIINTCYEMHIDDGNGLKNLSKIRDELDIFLDEIKVIHLKWDDGIPQKWLEDILSHDLNLIRNSEDIAKNLNSLFKKIISSKKRDAAFWKKISGLDFAIEEQLDGMLRMFREREALLGLKALSFEKAYHAARKDIAEKI